MKLYGRGLSEKIEHGRVVKTTVPFSFLGDVDPKTGIVEKKESELYGHAVKDHVLVFPSTSGSTVGSYVIFALKKYGNAPAAMIAGSGELIVTVGANMAAIPFVDGIDISLLYEGDDVEVNGSTGEIDIKGVKVENVATAILQSNNGSILLLKRSSAVSSYQNMWAAVSGRIEKNETPEAAASREIEEETGIRDITMIKKEKEIMVRNNQIIYIIIPMLFKVSSTAVSLNWENDDYAWVKPEKIKDLISVPKLDTEIEMLLSDGTVRDHGGNVH